MRSNMIRRSAVLLFTFFVIITVYSQNISFKYGNVTTDELKMNSYAKDTSAEAAVIYEYTNVYYDADPIKGFQVVTQYATKIKILTTEGLKYASITIPYYSKRTLNETVEEKIEELQGATYNLVNGKIVQKNLTLENIYDGHTSDITKEMKFSFPDVKPGSVIEYKYILRSDLFMYIPMLDIQKDIPMLHCEKKAEIPEYFIYDVKASGYPTPSVTKLTGKKTFLFGIDRSNKPTNTNTTIYKLSKNDIPAFKIGDYVWCPDDFRPRLEFELKEIKFRPGTYHHYTNTWQDVEHYLDTHPDFGKYYKLKYPYKKEIKPLLKITNEEERALAVLNLVRDKWKWNGKYQLFVKNINNTVQYKTGDNAQLNFVLMSALKAAKLKPYPVILSRRTSGRIPDNLISIDRMTTFIVAVKKPNGSYIFMDAGSPFGGLNVLDESLLAENARILNGKCEKIDLNDLVPNTQIIRIEAKLKPSGEVNGTFSMQSTGQCAYNFKRLYDQANSMTERTDNSSRMYNVNIKNYKGEFPDKTVFQNSEVFDFDTKAEVSGDRILFNPFIINFMQKNPFSEENRTYPVEFDYNTKTEIEVNLEIPQGYFIKKLPSSYFLSSADSSIKCIYSISQRSDIIQVRYTFERKKMFYLPDNYRELHDFYNSLTQQCKKYIELQKIN